MAESFNWTCPHCGHHTTINQDRFSVEEHRFALGSRYGSQILRTVVISCPNKDCRELTISAAIMSYKVLPSQQVQYGEARENWSLVPRATMKVFPDYVPAPILADYREACLIRTDSPKASATLARRCLQGMIRDFWGVKKDRLVEEIDAIKAKVDTTTWAAIDAVRSIGNIGAHMEKDINVIVDVDPDEAELLIGLLETVLTDWYVARHDRDERMKAIVAVAQAKKAAKSGMNTSP
jgi:Domain of unknown function (DUF4145)